MLRIISANLNGVRSAASKGFFDWMGKQDADFVCVQELKCAQDDMTPEFLAPHGYHGVFPVSYTHLTLPTILLV